jgi:hypothetical protein
MLGRMIKKFGRAQVTVRDANRKLGMLQRPSSRPSALGQRLCAREIGVSGTKQLF